MRCRGSPAGAFMTFAALSYLGWRRLGVAPHVADRILNHVGGTISGVAAVYQRHEFMAERKQAMERWGDHVLSILDDLKAAA